MTKTLRFQCLLSTLFVLLPQRANSLNLTSCRERLLQLDVEPLTITERLRATKTYKVYRTNMNPDPIWVGIEPGNPLTRDLSYRWNSLRLSGIHDAVRRHQVIGFLIENGIRHVRLGLSNHEIRLDREKSWQPFDEIINDFAGAGIDISLDLHHFGVEDDFLAQVPPHGQADLSKSFYLNPRWLSYFPRFALAAYKRYYNKIKAITIINEPEPTVSFNSELWHGGFPGWNHPENQIYYIERALRVGTAAALARYNIENYAQQLLAEGRIKTLPLFIHVEAVTIKPNTKGWDDFNKFIRFLPSDVVLGQDWLLNAPIHKLRSLPLDRLARQVSKKAPDQRTSLDWILQTYVFSRPQTQWNAARIRIVELLDMAKRAQRRLSMLSAGLSMKTRTIFGFDYYAHNEVKQDGSALAPEPQFYRAQVLSGERLGLIPVLNDYYNRYKLLMMMTETSTPYPDQAVQWFQSMGSELMTAISELHLPILNAISVYPLIDTRGWEHALSKAYDVSITNPAGLLTEGLDAREFVKPVLSQLRRNLSSLRRQVEPSTVAGH